MGISKSSCLIYFTFFCVTLRTYQEMGAALAVTCAKTGLDTGATISHNYDYSRPRTGPSTYGGNMYIITAVSGVDILLIVVLLLLIGGSLAYTLYRRRKGLGCSSCSGCPSKGFCGEAKAGAERDN